MRLLQFNLSAPQNLFSDEKNDGNKVDRCEKKIQNSQQSISGEKFVFFYEAPSKF
jgi:hypothetical protein